MKSLHDKKQGICVIFRAIKRNFQLSLVFDRDMELDVSYEETRQLEEIANNMAETKEKLQKSQKAL